MDVHIFLNITCSLCVLPVCIFKADHLALGNQLLCFPGENYFSCSQHPRVACSSLSGTEASWAFPLPTLARLLQLTLFSSHSASHTKK